MDWTNEEMEEIVATAGNGNDEPSAAYLRSVAERLSRHFGDNAALARCGLEGLALLCDVERASREDQVRPSGWELAALYAGRRHRSAVPSHVPPLPSPKEGETYITGSEIDPARCEWQRVHPESEDGLRARLKAADNQLEEWPARVMAALGTSCNPGEDCIDACRRVAKDLAASNAAHDAAVTRAHELQVNILPGKCYLVRALESLAEQRDGLERERDVLVATVAQLREQLAATEAAAKLPVNGPPGWRWDPIGYEWLRTGGAKPTELPPRATPPTPFFPSGIVTPPF